MTLSDFRHMALSLPGAEELNGLGYPNFRTGGKSFATIENLIAVIRLTRDQQAAFVAAAPEVFAPVSSGWGRLGTTVIRLDVADAATVQDAIATAWCNVADAGSVLDADIADAVGAVGVASVVDAASVAKVELLDHLESVIERLQMCWRTDGAAQGEDLHG
jgi:hypothetical protein